MRESLRELRDAARRLGRARSFSIPATLTLALGIGVTVAVFSIVRDILLDPLPYPDSGRLVWVDHGAPGLDLTQGLGITEGIYLRYRNENRSLEEIGLFSEADANLTGDGPPERVRAGLATPSLFRVLRTPAALGRTFLPADLDGERARIALLSHGLWIRRYGGDPGIVGRTITVDGRATEVVGVMPAGFAFPDDNIQLWVPLSPDPHRFGGFIRYAVARLAPAVDVAEAEADLQRLIRGLVDAYPGRSAEAAVNEARLQARVLPLKDQVVGDASRALWLVMVTVGLVLLIACTNVANLLLVRAETRDREVAIRRALGASTGRMARHHLAESVLVVVAAGTLGLGLAAGCVACVGKLGTASLPRIQEVGLDGAALGFAIGLAVVVSAIFGALPLLWRGPTSLMGALREGSPGLTAGWRRIRVRHVLVASQVALAVILLTGAGLMLRSFAAMRGIDPGFRSDHVLTFQIGLPPDDYSTRETAVALHMELSQRLAALPGVESVGASTRLPLAGSWDGSIVQVEGRPVRPGELPPVVAVRRVSPGYLETLGATLLRGRMLDRSDQERRTGAAVIDEAMAAAYWPSQDPLGQRFDYDPYVEQPDWYTVVGIVKNMPIRDLTESPARTMYLPLLHTDGAQGPSPYRLSYAIRTRVPPSSLAGRVRATVWALDDQLPVANVITMDAVVARAGARTKFVMVMLVIAALTALALGSVGLYSVVSYVVGRRVREIGVRKALGADARRVGVAVLRQGIEMAAVGLAVGLAVALAVNQALTAMLYSVTADDPVTYLTVSVLLFAVVVVATWVPARRAARVDPAVALREE